MHIHRCLFDTQVLPYALNQCYFDLWVIGPPLSIPAIVNPEVVLQLMAQSTFQQFVSKLLHAKHAQKPQEARDSVGKRY
ncbi:hypothetical protein FGO68_gene15173 [Halteria grandinella]|uniref:Uncharacterized protein n=1 Tax=Halteria grandinella TaxID=5974 RepID=A0A8J8NQS7_HALGN|nr:hypothetical protein FGO68_gene15173 [Halteria grandinella]